MPCQIATTGWASHCYHLSVPGKVFASIVLSRLRRSMETYFRQEQAGFRPGRSHNDQIFALRHITEKATAWQIPVGLMINFIDFRKAFDCIHGCHGLSLWLILRQYGIPDSIVAIIQSLYKSSNSIKLNGMTGNWSIGSTLLQAFAFYRRCCLRL